MDDYYLVEAKQEYTSYLINTLTPSMFSGFKDLFEQAMQITNGNSVFKNFQILLSNVPKWNNYMLEKEVLDITKETGCDWLDNLITAVFVSHSKILTSVKVGNYRPKNKKIDLKIPDTISFIHQCYVESAREFYKNPMLFLDNTRVIRPDEILKNSMLAQSIIKESILNTIRKLLPFRNILTEYLALDTNQNTIYIGNTSVGSTAIQPKTIEAPPIILPAITEPLEINKNLEIDNSNVNDNVSTKKPKQTKKKPVFSEKPKSIPKNTNFFLDKQNDLDSLDLESLSKPKITPRNNDIDKTISAEHDLSSEEKEVAYVGKELDLNDLKIDTNIDLETLDIKKEEQSLDSVAIKKLVNNISNEYNSKQIESSLDLDNISFLKYKNDEDDKQKINELLDFRDDVTNDTKTPNKNDEINDINLDDLSIDSLPKSPIKQVEKVDKSESMDLENIKKTLDDEGTLQDNKAFNKLSFLNKIHLPMKVEKESVDKPKMLQQIKTISIKLNPNNKKLAKKKKTTLLDMAEDDDSSEMVFK